MRLPSVFWKKPRSHQPDKAGGTPTDQAEAEETGQWSRMQSESLVLVMGVTGAGKSYFINKLKPNSVTEGHGLGSQTKTCDLVQLRVGACTVAAVDTPGFDDDEDSDAIVLAKITRFLSAQYHLGISLKGIVFLHSINSNRFSGSEKRYLDTFREICGDEAFSNVALVSTMWDSVDPGVGLRRENELQCAHWAALISKGAYVFQYNGSPDMARTIVGQLIMKDDVVLKIQKEISSYGCQLDSTSAGGKLASKLDKQLQERRQTIHSLTMQLKSAEAAQHSTKMQELRKQLHAQRDKQLKQLKARDELRPKISEETEKRILEVDKDKKSKGEKWKSRLQIFAAVLTPVIALVVQLILPLAGVSLGSA